MNGVTSVSTGRLRIREGADATVVEVKDGIPENTPGEASHAVEITLETVAGNHVNLDLGGGVFAMYAHFQPGSIRVKVGDKVSCGQALGLVGNSGNSSEPHLYFQLMDRNSPLDSEGLPYKMVFQLTGHSSGLAHPTIDHLPSPRTEQGEMPLENEIVDFTNAPLWLSSVVPEELYAGAGDRERRAAERLERDFDRVKRLLHPISSTGLKPVECLLAWRPSTTTNKSDRGS